MYSRLIILAQMNILVNDFERACITDFGLSSIRTDQTLAYTFAGTTTHGCSYHWAAPELVDESAHGTSASDVWALGCVFYEVRAFFRLSIDLINKSDQYRSGSYGFTSIWHCK